MRLYLAGPMTGHPQFNIPEFDRWANILRMEGYDVVSPAELDDPRIRAISLASEEGHIATLESHGATWGDFLARDVKLIADDGFHGVVVLHGWETSRGARLETFVAGALMGLPVWEVGYDAEGDLRFHEVTDLRLARAWTRLDHLSLRKAHPYGVPA